MRNLRLIGVLLLLWLPLKGFAVEVKADAPKTYVVVKGDTLWDIAGMFLDKPWLWPELWRNNTDISNPHLIYPGDVLRLIFDEEGEPQIVVERAPEKPFVKLTPQGRIEQKARPIDVLPFDVIRPYIENAAIMDESEYEALPYLLGNHEGIERFVSGVHVLGKASRSGETRFDVIRQQNVVRDREGNKLGIQVRHISEAVATDDDLDKQQLVKIVDGHIEAKRGDRLIPMQEPEVQEMQLIGAVAQRGFLVDSLEQHGLLGKFDIVVIDLGKGDVMPGTVMGVYNQGPNIVDGKQPKYANEDNALRSAFEWGDEIVQPSVKVGELVVFKTFDKASYALLTKASNFIRVGAIVARP
ncbi:LysM domain-containing protein [Alteromonadaceae bacterium M269]|nr:LysM domain-containing protein [Alteromonadaceae bacterium M269]